MGESSTRNSTRTAPRRRGWLVRRLARASLPRCPTPRGARRSHLRPCVVDEGGLCCPPTGPPPRHVPCHLAPVEARPSPSPCGWRSRRRCSGMSPWIGACRRFGPARPRRSSYGSHPGQARGVVAGLVLQMHRDQLLLLLTNPRSRMPAAQGGVYGEDGSGGCPLRQLALLGRRRPAGQSCCCLS